MKMQKALCFDALIEKKIICTCPRVNQHYVIQLNLKTILGEVDKGPEHSHLHSPTILPMLWSCRLERLARAYRSHELLLAEVSCIFCVL
jgi:hypothetical protein